MNLQQRLDKALGLHGQGYNCSQCVLMAFDDLTALSPEVSAAVSSMFGRGFAGRQQLCGAVAGAGMVVGMCRGGSLDSRNGATALTAAITREFEDKAGSLICAELRRPGRLKCSQLIEQAVTLVYNHLSQKQ